ncbi:MAG: hypothetical protein WBE45_00145 [Terriglobales bacterium]
MTKLTSNRLCQVTQFSLVCGTLDARADPKYVLVRVSHDLANVP